MRARLAVGLALVVGGQLLEEVLDLGSQALVERVAGRGHFGQEGTRPAVVAGAQGRQGRFVEAERSTLLGQPDLGDQLVGLGIDAELARLGLVGELLGCLVVAVLVEFLGLAEQDFATVRVRDGRGGDLGGCSRFERRRGRAGSSWLRCCRCGTGLRAFHGKCRLLARDGIVRRRGQVRPGLGIRGRDLTNCRVRRGT